MAIAGSAIPAYQVRINGGNLAILDSTLMPVSVVQRDMVLAAEALRRHPGKMIRIDAKRYLDLQDYLRNSGHVE